MDQTQSNKINRNLDNSPEQKEVIQKLRESKYSDKTREQWHNKDSFHPYASYMYKTLCKSFF